MKIKIVSAGSSSSGNSYIIRAAGRTIILDVGLPAKTIIAALGEAGADPADVDAVFITHEHTDHVKSIRAISRKCCNAQIYASRGTVLHTENFKYVPEDRLGMISDGETVILEGSEPASEYYDNYKDIKIRAFSLSHDAAEPLGYSFEYGGEKLSVVTDTGIVTEGIYDAVKDSDTLVFEANHDEQMLMYGEYPYQLKMRIKGTLGHLSNDCAGDFLARILKHRKTARNEEQGSQKAAGDPLHIMLAHLSFHNNAPFFARQTVEEKLEKSGFTKDKDYTLDVAAKEGLSYIADAAEA